MRTLRVILIAVLAVAIPLPATAAAFGAPPCMEMSAAETSAAESAVADQTQMSEAEQEDECGCGQCDNCAACDAPCATGGTATLNKASQAFNLLPLQSPRTTALRARALPAHPEDLIRPPSLIQS